VKLTGTRKVSLDWVAPRALTTTRLAGAEMSMSHEVDSDPLPASPFWSRISAALTVRV
jgi:hypothetical protein